MVVHVNDNVTFSVAASGDGLTYQWQKEFRNLSEKTGKLEGVKTPTLRVFNAQKADQASYSCLVTNGAGNSRTSLEASLSAKSTYRIVGILAIIMSSIDFREMRSIVNLDVHV